MKLITLLIFLIVLFLPEQGASASPLRPITKDSRVLVMGSSSMQGMAPHLERIAKSNGVPLIGRGVPNSRIDQWIVSEQFEKELVDFKPTHVIMSIGINDIYTDKKPELVASQVKRLIDKIKLHGAIPVWIGAPKLVRYNGRSPRPELIETIMEIPEFYYHSERLDIPRSPDKLHATREGYSLWSQEVWGWINSEH